jgi:hypothetical protein
VLACSSTPTTALCALLLAMLLLLPATGAQGGPLRSQPRRSDPAAALPVMVLALSRTSKHAGSFL